MQSQNTNPILTAAHAAHRMRRRLATAFAVLLAVGFGYHAIFGRNGLTAYAQKRSEDKMLVEKINTLQSENERLQNHVDHLQKDPDAIEHEARARLHYTKPGEVIYTLNDRPASDNAGDARPARK